MGHSRRSRREAQDHSNAQVDTPKQLEHDEKNRREGAASACVLTMTRRQKQSLKFLWARKNSGALIV